MAARRTALEVAGRALAGGAAVREAVVLAAEALAAEPWHVVVGAGGLARAHWSRAATDLGITATLRAVPADDPRAVVVVPAGSWSPAGDRVGTRARGAYDTPPSMARFAVDAALGSVRGPVQRGLDVACGTGALLVALAERGVADVVGSDRDPLALAVAQVAVPRARLSVADALDGGPSACVVVGNPPFVSPERQDKALRTALRERFPWLRGRFDLAVPLAAVMVERARPGGGVGLILPVGVLVEPYGEPLRRQWLSAHRLTALGAPQRFPGTAIDVAVVGLAVGDGPADLPCGVPAAELLALARAPLDHALLPGDVALVRHIRARSRTLGTLGVVDTGLVAHGAHGGKAALLVDREGPDTVPFAEASDFFAGRRQWLRYQPDRMHRPKSPALFEAPKLVVQRIIGRQPVRAGVDRTGVYVGHTCTVVVPRDERIGLDRLAELVTHPLVAGLLRIERGPRLDLYPHDVAGIPVPEAWWTDPSVPLATAWGLDPAGIDRLLARAGS